MILITTFYIPNNDVREKEINECLQKNCDNHLIHKIFLLNDKIYQLPINNGKIQQIVISNSSNYKLRFDDAINFINNSKDCNGQICILSNSDIYFNETLSLIDYNNMTNNVFGLLRYDQNENGGINFYSKNGEPRTDSQDCWIFKSPLNIDTKMLNFEFGTLGCDNVFANIIYNSGIYISNPCYSIVSIHVHSSNYRTYLNETRLDGPYCNLVPCKLREMPAVFFTDMFSNRIN